MAQYTLAAGKGNIMAAWEQAVLGFGDKIYGYGQDRYLKQRQERMDAQAQSNAERAYGMKREELDMRKNEAISKQEAEAQKRKITALNRAAAHYLSVPAEQRDQLYARQKPMLESALGIQLPATMTEQDARAYLAQGISAEKQFERLYPKPTSAYQNYQMAQQDPGFAAYQTEQKRAGATNVSVNTGATLSPGQKAIDTAFAKDVYVPFAVEGGYADAKKQLGQLSEALAALQDPSKELTGPVIGMTPDTVLTMFNPESVDVRETIEEVVQRNLRLVLGAQFTEKEGERLIARAFNPKLSPERNARRLQRLINQIAEAADAKQQAVDYFDANETLKGFRGKSYKMADFYKALSDSEGGEAKKQNNASSMTDEQLLKELGL